MAGESAINIQKILNNGESPAAIVLSSAILWHSASVDLVSLDNRCWIESTVADFYLASLWHNMHGNFPFRLVTIFYDSHNLEVPLEVINRYRHTHYFPANGPCPIVPVGFLVHDPGTTVHTYWEEGSATTILITTLIGRHGMDLNAGRSLLIFTSGMLVI